MNRGFSSTWSAADDAELFRLYVTEGRSSSQCVPLLSKQRTRNAVIGRVFRLGFKRENAAPPTVFKSYPVRKAIQGVRRKQTPAPSFLAPGYNLGGPKAPTVATPADQIQSPNAKVWTERESGECAFPLEGRGEGADTVSCSNPCTGNYCHDHQRIMWAKAPDTSTRKPRKPYQTGPERAFEKWAAA